MLLGQLKLLGIVKVFQNVGHLLKGHAAGHSHDLPGIPEHLVRLNVHPQVGLNAPLGFFGGLCLQNFCKLLQGFFARNLLVYGLKPVKGLVEHPLPRILSLNLCHVLYVRHELVLFGGWQFLLDVLFKGGLLLVNVLAGLL